jgi:alpha-L-rhamnosidase
MSMLTRCVVAGLRGKSEGRRTQWVKVCPGALICLWLAWGEGQQAVVGGLDPARDARGLMRAPKTDLQEEFIWTMGDAAALHAAYQASVRGQNDKIAAHYFRREFAVAEVPKEATLYVAGPRSATVYLNGVKVLAFADDGEGKGFHVRRADVAGALRPGRNVLAMELVRGHSSLHTGAGPVINQVTYGEVLAVKIVPCGVGVAAAPLVVSDGGWKSTLAPATGWQEATFDDAAWKPVQTLGALGSRSDFLQWNADAGLYAWPGYAGIGPAMRTFWAAPVAVRDANGKVEGGALAALRDGKLEVLAGDAPVVMTLDFGKELSGRVRLVSSSGERAEVATSYGESYEEADGHAYLGVRGVDVPPDGTEYGPKSGFRYVRLTFPAHSRTMWKAIDVQGIAYPVTYAGEFESSDAEVNRIWETGAYTAHLCMQEDGVWDAPKRDRGRWMGDLDVTGRTIDSVFGDRALMEETLDAVIGEAPVTRDVNTIPGYSALWVTGLAEFDRHVGDKDFLLAQKARLLGLLTEMDGELGPEGLFVNAGKRKVFVDWSEGFSADSPEARAATHLEFCAAYQEAAYLLGEMGDAADAAVYGAKAERMRAAAQERLVSGGTFGDRWQENAMAVVAGVATPQQDEAIWTKVLAGVMHPAADAPGITPYYGFYVLEAMAATGHATEALGWMKSYWGGMLAEGATSFYEAYDPRWPKENFHAFLQADGKTGYYVSLAHGWASGPTAWLMEEVLGIRPTGAGFGTVTIRPELAGLAWARGAEPTPRGVIRVSVKADEVKLRVPQGTDATVVLPFQPAGGRVLENGRMVAAIAAEDGTRTQVELRKAGDYTFTYREASR